MKQSGSVQSAQTCQYYPSFLYVAVRPFSVIIIITINVKLKIITIKNDIFDKRKACHLVADDDDKQQL